MHFVSLLFFCLRICVLFTTAGCFTRQNTKFDFEISIHLPAQCKQSDRQLEDNKQKNSRMYSMAYFFRISILPALKKTSYKLVIDDGNLHIYPGQYQQNTRDNSL